MSFLSDLVSKALAAIRKTLPASISVSSAGTHVTAAELEKATESLATFFRAFYSAVKAKNMDAEIELTLEEAVTVASDLGFGEPFTGLAKVILPLVFGEFNRIAAQPLLVIDSGYGGFVTQAWIDQPRHQLDGNGDFKN